MEKELLPEDFQYNEGTASWRLKAPCRLADAFITVSIEAAAFPDSEVDWEKAQQFLSYLQKHGQQITGNIARATTIIEALQRMDPAPAVRGIELKLEQVILRRYSGNGYRFTYDLLVTSNIINPVTWMITLKEQHITGVGKNESSV
jgi:hypothetical protein